MLRDHDGDRRADVVSLQADETMELACDPLLTLVNQRKPAGETGPASIRNKQVQFNVLLTAKQHLRTFIQIKDHLASRVNQCEGEGGVFYIRIVEN